MVLQSARDRSGIDDKIDEIKQLETPEKKLGPVRFQIGQVLTTQLLPSTTTSQ